jgi:hypothetical protein
MLKAFLQSEIHSLDASLLTELYTATEPRVVPSDESLFLLLPRRAISCSVHLSPVRMPLFARALSSAR